LGKLFKYLYFTLLEYSICPELSKVFDLPRIEELCSRQILIIPARDGASGREAGRAERGKESRGGVRFLN
jgi:hypothetical protein